MAGYREENVMIGGALREMREVLGIPAAQVAIWCGVKEATVFSWETGRTGIGIRKIVLYVKGLNQIHAKRGKLLDERTDKFRFLLEDEAHKVELHHTEVTRLANSLKTPTLVG